MLNLISRILDKCGSIESTIQLLQFIKTGDMQDSGVEMLNIESPSKLLLWQFKYKEKQL
jgi:hypothetical protein